VLPRCVVNVPAECQDIGLCALRWRQALQLVERFDWVAEFQPAGSGGDVAIIGGGETHGRWPLRENFPFKIVADRKTAIIDSNNHR
jgi:hypothetical protein